MGEDDYIGPPVDDGEVLERVPEELAVVLRQTNGFIRFRGGLHVRGACTRPLWHSLRAAWVGPTAFWELYWSIQPADIPFAEDCMGDQFLLREGLVLRLACETGEVEHLKMGFPQFLAEVHRDPIEFLQMQPLLRYEAEGGRLEPGQLLAAYPPFFVEQEGPASLRPIDAGERRSFLADVARQVRDVPDGGRIRFDWKK